MSIATEIQRLQQAKADIKTAIENKGVTVGDGTIDTFASKINEITGGGGSIPTGYHTVTFMNGDNKLFERLVLSGDDCPDPLTQGRIETPTKESTAQYDYTYSGWSATNGGTANSNVLKNITKDKVVYSAFTSTVREYTVTFYDEDSITVLHTEQVAYGTIPSYTPTKDGVAFDKWTPTLVKVTGNASYIANWTSVLGSGTCGDTVMWALSNDYTLTISGTGNMKTYSNYGDTRPPWYSYANQIVALNILDSVTSISNYAFQDCTSLTSVNIGNGITDISYSAFSRCTSLTSITIPNSVTSIGNSAFSRCTSLTSITIPNSVTSIGNSAFNRCTSLTSITIPNSVTSIGDSAFNRCTSLTSIDVDSDNLYYCSLDGILFDITKTIFLAYPIGKNLPSYNIPNGVTTIKKIAFSESPYLTSIVIPNSVVTIEGNTFTNCKLITSITIPDSVTEIGSMSFMGCSNLANAIFEDVEGWEAGNTVLSSTDLANSITAAQYLNNTYQYNTWTKS